MSVPQRRAKNENPSWRTGVRNWIQALIAAVAGGALVWAMFWLVESILPGWLFLPMEVGRLAILVATLGVPAVLARLWPLSAAAFLAGAGIEWALHEVNPVTLCQSDALYRPCTTSEIAWMVVPPIVVLLIPAATAARARQLRTARGRLRAS